MLVVYQTYGAKKLLYEVGFSSVFRKMPDSKIHLWTTPYRSWTPVSISVTIPMFLPWEFNNSYEQQNIFIPAILPANCVIVAARRVPLLSHRTHA